MRREITAVTHGEDIDGAMCAILLGLVDGEDSTKLTHCIGVQNKSEYIKDDIDSWSTEILDNMESLDKEDDVEFIFMICDLDIDRDIIGIIENWILSLNHELTELPNVKASVVVVDHHQESRKYARSIRNGLCIVSDSQDGIVGEYRIVTPESWEGFEDVDKQSAASVLLRYLKEHHFISEINDKVYEMTNSVSRYDTWSWKDNPSENVFGSDYPIEFYFYTMFGILGIENWIVEFGKILIDENASLTPDAFVNAAKKSYEGIERFVERMDKQLVFTRLSEYTIGIIVCSHGGGNFSIMANKLCEIHPEMDFVVALFPENRSFSLRSTRNTLDCSRIAKWLSENGKGGGHPRAAGGTMTPETMRDFLMSYWRNETDNKED